MITNSKYQSISHSQNHNNWSFIPTALSALAGIGIGFLIGNYLGWL